MQIFGYYIVLTYIKRQVCKDLTISKLKYLGTQELLTGELLYLGIHICGYADVYIDEYVSENNK